jgi:hypothetical protein
MACIVNRPGAMTVHPGPHRLALVADPEDADDRAGDEPAEHPEARVGGQGDADEVALVEVPAVDDVVEPTADEGGDGHHDHPVGDERRVEALAARLVGEDEIDRDEPEGVADPVPVDGDRAELDEDRVGGEVEHDRRSVRPTTHPARERSAPYTSGRMIDRQHRPDPRRRPPVSRARR